MILEYWGFKLSRPKIGYMGANLVNKRPKTIVDSEWARDTNESM